MQESTNPKDKIGRTKPPLHLIPPAAMIVESLAMGLGAVKYGPYNWRGASVAASVYVGAAMRHLTQWWDGEELDPESGAPHLGHARACLAILIDAASVGNMVDDRPPKGAAADLIRKYTKPMPPPQDIRNGDGTTGDFEYDEARKLSEPPLTPMQSLVVKLIDSGATPEVAQIIAAGTTFAPEPTGDFVYIAGPMRGIKEYNFPAFDRARDHFIDLGYNVISPADIDRAAGQGKPTAEEVAKLTADYVYRDIMALIFMSRHNPNGLNAVALLDGWERSTGALGEFSCARWLGLNLYNEQGATLRDCHGPTLLNSINKTLIR